MDIAGAPNKRWKTASDHIFDFTWSGYKIIPNMWSELAEVRSELAEVTPDHKNQLFDKKG
jgi:hypothetical protein